MSTVRLALENAGHAVRAPGAHGPYQPDSNEEAAQNLMYV